MDKSFGFSYASLFFSYKKKPFFFASFLRQFFKQIKIGSSKLVCFCWIKASDFSTPAKSTRFSGLDYGSNCSKCPARYIFFPAEYIQLSLVLRAKIGSFVAPSLHIDTTKSSIEKSSIRHSDKAFRHVENL